MVQNNPADPDERVLEEQFQCRMKHLDFIQATVVRLAGNSFALKGWSIALAAAVIALGAQSDAGWFLAAFIFPIVILCVLDALYLAYEKQYRDLYNTVAAELRAGSVVQLLDMSPAQALPQCSAFKQAIFSPSVWLLHLAGACCVVLVAFLTSNQG
jgi:hypothetical protein